MSTISGADPIAVVGATVLDGNGGPPIADGVIVVSGARIVAVGDRSTPIPPDARRIEAAGKHVIPGIICAHTYLADGTWPALTIRFEGRYDEVAIESAQVALRGGVTTIFDNWGQRDALITARDAINRGDVPGARVFVTGNWIGMGGPYSEDMRAQFRDAVGEPFAARIDALWECNVGTRLLTMTTDEIRAEVREYAASGIDYLTYPVNVHRRGAFPFLTFPPATQRVIVDEAHRAGIPVKATFATTDEGYNIALDAGADLVWYVPFAARPMLARTIERVARERIPVFDMGLRPESATWFRERGNEDMAVLADAQLRDARALIDAGAVLCEGSYTAVWSDDQLRTWQPAMPGMNYVPIGEGHIAGLRVMLDRGVRPMDGLLAATKNLAAAYRVDRDLGTLEPGKLADLVVLDGDPLADVANYGAIHLVMKDGRVVDRDALPTKRLMTARPGEDLR